MYVYTFVYDSNKINNYLLVSLHIVKYEIQ